MIASKLRCCSSLLRFHQPSGNSLVIVPKPKAGRCMNTIANTLRNKVFLGISHKHFENSSRMGQRFVKIFARQGHAQATAISSEQVVLVKNDKLIPCQQNSGDWLSSAPRGAYTTGRTVGRDSVFEFEFHIERLASSVRLMLEADARGLDGEETEFIPPHLAPVTQASSLRPLVLSSLKTALTEFYKVNQGVVDPTAEVRLTVLISWEGKEQDEGDEDKEGGHPGVDILSHLTSMPPLPSPPVKVLVKGAPRSNAAAKDSDWIRERKGLEEEKAKDVNEVVLLDDAGAMFEGLSSNFFAVTKEGTLVTAGEGILAGTVREVLLDCCKKEGIPVLLEPPVISDIDSWEGAIVSSTSRLALPIDQLNFFTEQGEQVVEFKDDTLTRRIAMLVQQAVEDNCTKIM